jgi:hypothetical protein
MGCPPDPVEVSIWRSGERIDSLQQKYDRLRGEYAEAAKLAFGLVSAYKAEGGYPPAEKFERRTTVNPTEFEPYADDSDQYRMERENEAKVKELENRLCVLRTELLGTGKSGPEITKQRALHLAHRLDDREAWSAWLREKIQLLEFLLGSKDSHELDQDAARQMISDLNTEVGRLQNLSEQELLFNRDSLRADEKFWQTPYLPFD